MKKANYHSVLLLSLLLTLTGCFHRKKDEIQFTLVLNSTQPFSLNPESADILTNAIILDHTIETLFKYYGSGEPSRSAVKSYEVLNENKTWIFYLKEGLIDSESNPLTPSYWCNGISEVVKRLPAKENMLLLSHLDGWDNYISGKSKLPILCDDKRNQIILNFKSTPNGVTDLLTNSVLGFWNFKKNKYTDYLETGAFKIVNFQDRRVELKKEQMSRIVQVIPYEQIGDYKVASNEIVFPAKPFAHLLKSSRAIKTSPSKLLFVEINPFSKKFKDINIRNYVSGLLINLRSKLKSIPLELIESNSLYLDVKKPIEYNFDSNLRLKKFPNLKIVYSATSTNEAMDGLIREFISNLTEDPHYIYSKPTDLYLKAIQTRDFDIRIGAVVSGTYPDKWVTEMMFCTLQGISFIDHKNEICNLTKDVKTSIDLLEYGERINSILSKNKTLIPLFNSSFLLYIGEGIDSHVSAANPSVRLDLVKLKE